MIFWWWWCWYFDDVDVLTIMMFWWWWCFHDDVSDRKIRVLWWWWCCWSKGQNTEDVADWKIKVLKMLMKLFLIERSKYWRCWCWSKGQSADVAYRKIRIWWWCCSNTEEFVADPNNQSVAVTEDWRLKMKTTWCWKDSNDL